MSQLRFGSVAEIIAFAIRREIEAAEGYARIAGLAATPGLRALAEDLRGQELEHRRLLEELPAGMRNALDATPAPDLKLVDALPDGPPDPDMSVQDLLIFAAKKEARAVALYESLARLAVPSGQDRIFVFLAGQEREHKLRLEAAYEAHVLPEN